MASYEEHDSTAINSIATGTDIEGNIQAKGDVRIDGTLTGNLDLKGRLVVGKTGVIKGEITCSNCDIQGKISGKISVREQLSLKPSAVVEGEVFAKKLLIEPGAEFNVVCKMNDKNNDFNSEFEQEEGSKKNK